MSAACGRVTMLLRPLGTLRRPRWLWLLAPLAQCLAGSWLEGVVRVQGHRSPSQEDGGATMPVEAPLLGPLHALQEAAGEEGHGHEQDDSTADDGGDHSHPEAEGLMGHHSCKRQDQLLAWSIEVQQWRPPCSQEPMPEGGRAAGC